MKNQYFFVFLLGLITGSCLFWVNGASAANYVKIAVIGEVPRTDNNQESQKIVDQVISFWKKQLDQVLPDKPDLILLPEACDRPAGMSREKLDSYYDVRKDQIKEFFSSVAKENRCYIAFGTKHPAADGNWYNSCYVLDRNGGVAGIYHKNFPTIGEIESGIKASDEVPLIRCDFGRVACVICFDLNFQELMVKYQKAKPDIILFPSMYHGGLVQSYWAYSCRSFFVSAVAGRSNPSEIRDPLGGVIATTTNYFGYVVAKVNLDCQLVHLDFNWEKLAGLKEKYGDAVNIKDPGKLGAVLVTSEAEKVTVNEMIEEFGIEILDDYFDRSRGVRSKPGNMDKP